MLAKLFDSRWRCNQLRANVVFQEKRNRQDNFPYLVLKYKYKVPFNANNYNNVITMTTMATMARNKTVPHSNITFQLKY